MGKRELRRRFRRPADVFHLKWFFVVLLSGFLFAFVAAPPVCADLDLAPDLDSAWFLNMNGLNRSAHTAFSCEECHGDMKQAGREHPDSSAPAFLKEPAVLKYDYTTCRRCHATACERTQSGKHAEALQLEQKEPERALDPRKRAPRCGDCHNSHYEPSHRTRVEVGKAMVAVCRSCHPAETAAYLENRHGRSAVYLGDEMSAFCTDCHGAHTTVSLKDRTTAVKACRRCHADAGESFAEVVIHQTAVKDLDGKENADKRARVAVIRTVTAIMTVLVLLVVVFFYGHSFLWLLRELHEKLRKRGL